LSLAPDDAAGPPLLEQTSETCEKVRRLFTFNHFFKLFEPPSKQKKLEPITVEN